jgi:hypothetical protein
LGIEDLIDGSRGPFGSENHSVLQQRIILKTEADPPSRVNSR